MTARPVQADPEKVCPADQKRILQLAVEAGETLLVNGGEIFRVQDTMERVARALGARDFHAYVLTNGLFASIDGGQRMGSAVRALSVGSMHLGRIMAVNALSRDIVEGKTGLEEAFQRLDEIRRMPYKSSWTRIAACGVGAGCFAYLFGGTPIDAMVGCAVGLLLEPLRLWLERVKTGKFISILLSSVWVALLSMVFVTALGHLGVSASLDKAIIGGIIPLVPGIALTNGIRDIAGGDYLSGTIRAIDALLIGAAIALGVGLVLKLGVWMTGVAV